MSKRIEMISIIHYGNFSHYWWYILQRSERKKHRTVHLAAQSVCLASKLHSDGKEAGNEAFCSKCWSPLCFFLVANLKFDKYRDADFIHPLVLGTCPHSQSTNTAVLLSSPKSSFQIEVWNIALCLESQKFRKCEVSSQWRLGSHVISWCWSRKFIKSKVIYQSSTSKVWSILMLTSSDKL